PVPPDHGKTFPGVVWAELQFAGQLPQLPYPVDRWCYAPDSEGITLFLDPKGREAALAAFDYICLDMSLPAVGEVLQNIPAERRILFVRWSPMPIEALVARFSELAKNKAAFYQVVIASAEPADGLLPLLLLKRLGRRDVVAYQDSPAGAWTRLLAPSLGAPFV